MRKRRPRGDTARFFSPGIKIIIMARAIFDVSAGGTKINARQAGLSLMPETRYRSRPGGVTACHALLSSRIAIDAVFPAREP